MKNRRTTRIAIAAALALPLVTSARDLTLAGSSDATWNTDAANTTWNANGSPTAFANGDDATIGSAFTGSKITFGARVTPGDVVFDIGRTLTLDFGSKNTYGLGIGTKSFTKRGSGTLLMTNSKSTNLNSNGDERFGNAVTAGVEIVEGEIALRDPNVHHYFGPRTIPHWVHVRSGASLTFLARNQSGAHDNNECGLCVELDPGAWLNHCTNDPPQNDCRPLALHTLKLSGGDFTNGVNAYRTDNTKLGGKCSMYLFNTLWFSGSTPHAFGFDSGYDGCKRYAKGATVGSGTAISLNVRHPVEFRVDDITANDGIDAYVNMNMFTWAQNAQGVFKADIEKTGAGTLSIRQKPDTKDFLGDITVSEGTLEFAAQGILPFSTDSHAATAEQTLIVTNGATLAISIRNIVLGDRTKNDVLTRPRLKLVVDGGTFQYHTTASNVGCNRFRECVFHDATIDLANPGQSGASDVYGILAFMGPVTFSGSTPYVLDVNPDIANNSQAIVCFNDPRTTFNVADITGDGAADVTLGIPLYNYATNNNTRSFLEGCGFVKTGEGTLRLTYTFADEQKSLNGPVDVSNGVLRVDGRLTGPSMLTVAAGGFLGGTGTVNRVTLEPGAGLAALAGQTAPLHVRKSLALPATGVVEVSNPDGLDPNGLRTLPVLTAATDGDGSLTGTENLANWTVTFNGVHNGSWTLFADGNTVKAKHTSATIIILR